MEYGTAFESAAIAYEWLAQHKATFGHFINGKMTVPPKAKFFTTTNPATGEKLAKIAMGAKADVDAAVKAARTAQKKWQALDGFERAKYLYALARLIQKNIKLLAVVETLDNGKAFGESNNMDIPLAARHFYYHAGWAQILDTEFPSHEACGVVGQIIPWNFPFLMMAWKIAPALAAGNCVVLKPAEFTPLTAMLFAELCGEAGIPAGVINIVQGDGGTGAEIVNHKGIDKIAFTGSTDVGRIIRNATAGSAKSLTLELGGKSPVIVFENADLDGAVEGIVGGIWFNQGQMCCATSRLLVQEGIADKLVKKLTARMAKIRIGSPLDKTMDMGTVIHHEQLAKIAALVKKGVAEGATLIQPTKDSCPEGCYYPPTILTNVQTSATVASEEIFGPVIVVLTFRTPEEAVQIANNSRYGLAASIWSENINLALDIAPKLKAGVVWINSSIMMDATCGFGGYRESGFGREGGREGMEAYLKPKFLKTLPSYKESKKKISAAKHAVVAAVEGVAEIDRTAKLYIGGKQTRPDGGYSISIINAKDKLIGQVGEGNRKDIRNAVEAAKKAEGWSKATTALRSQILYYIAENLSARKDEFKKRIAAMTGVTPAQAQKEVDESVRRLFTYAAWCDKYDGAVHTPPARSLVAAMKESVGIMGLVCPDEMPLLGLVSLFAPVMAMGNRAVIIPSEKYPLAATDFYQILDTSDVPAGVVNIVTGNRAELTKSLAEHDEVDALWYFGSDMSGSALVEKSSIGNLKRTWVNNGLQRDWFNRAQSEGAEFLSHAVEIKNIWIPYGE
jgi:aldehyde dehydrogenase (NAD+)